MKGGDSSVLRSRQSKKPPWEVPWGASVVDGYLRVLYRYRLQELVSLDDYPIDLHFGLGRQVLPCGTLAELQKLLVNQDYLFMAGHKISFSNTQKKKM